MNEKQFYVTEQHGQDEINVTESLTENPIQINVGINASLIISKLFGPTIFADIRITSVMKGREACWLIEREDIDTQEFKEIIKIPAQIDSDFPDDKDEQ